MAQRCYTWAHVPSTQLREIPDSRLASHRVREAKADVAQIIDQLGWEGADMGTATAARAIEALCKRGMDVGRGTRRRTQGYLSTATRRGTGGIGSAIAVPGGVDPACGGRAAKSRLPDSRRGVSEQVVDGEQLGGEAGPGVRPLRREHRVP